MQHPPERPPYTHPQVQYPLHTPPLSERRPPLIYPQQPMFYAPQPPMPNPQPMYYSPQGYPLPPQPYPMQQQPVPYPQPYFLPQQMMAQNYVMVNMQVNKPQVNFLIRVIYFFCVGWWLGMCWISIALLLCMSIIGLPVGVMMLNYLPAILTLKQ